MWYVCRIGEAGNAKEASFYCFIVMRLSLAT
jgi:hypothetical protein